MYVQRFEVSARPHLTIARSEDDLIIRGEGEREIVVKLYGDAMEMEVSREGETFTLSLQARCTILCPEGTTVTVERTEGNLTLRRLEGPLALRQVRGDLVLKQVGPTTADEVQGDLHARRVQGNLTLGQVFGDVVLKQVEGPLTARQIAGDLVVRDLEGGADVEQVEGDLLLHTPLTAGKAYRFQVDGDALLRLDEESNVQVTVQAGGDIIEDEAISFAERQQQERHRLVGRIGAGEATLEVQAGGDVLLSPPTEGVGVAFGVTLGEEIEETIERVMVEVGRQLDARLSEIDTLIQAQLGRWEARKVRRKAEKAARRAQRHARKMAKAARRRAREAQRQWRWWEEDVAPERDVRTPRDDEPVTEEERLMVLRMVEAGKLSAEEAARLLEAMEA